MGARNLPPRLEIRLNELTDDEFEKKRLISIVRCILKVLDALDSVCNSVLCKTSVFPSLFDLNGILAVVGSGEKKSAVKRAVSTLTSFGLLEQKDGLK